MQKLRIIISCFLLFTYSLGFAHYLVPHCDSDINNHEVGTHQDNHHHHTHHQHDDSERLGDHKHIKHNGHLDGDLSDYILCLLTDTTYPIEDCNAEHCFLVNRIVSTDTQFNNLISFNLVYVDSHVPDLADLFSRFPEDVEATYLPPPIEYSPHRGPPLFSC